MNKPALKRFATEARRELLERVELQARKVGITAEGIQKAQIESSDAIFIDGKQLSEKERVQRNKLIARIRDIGFNRVMEETAYTWFNRFTALRFMEVNDYLPTRVRVLSSTNAENTEPDMIKEALSLDLDLDKEHIYDLKLNNKDEELFKYLIIKHCNDMNRYMPFMFETIDDYTEILFPEGLLATDSFVRKMTNVEIIPENNWEKIEVIGWLYQYYIAEEKDRVFKAKKKYKAEEIPFATQLFTPDWIVRYMVQNSLGRYWIEAHSEHLGLIDNWEFYLQSTEEDFEGKIAPYINKELKVEEIKCFDPAMGSGHILVYMFDILYEIYSRSGYTEREIPRLIIENNLYGLDIDDRAYQLASFSVVMKALEYNKRFLRSIEREGLTLNLASIQETNTLTKEDIEFLSDDSSTNLEETQLFIQQFKDAKTIGSLIKVTERETSRLQKRLEFIQTTPITNLFEIEQREKILSILPKLIKQAQIMSLEFDVLVTNPPYMGSGSMNKELAEYLKKNYPDSKADLFAAFMEVDHYLKPKGFFASINQHAWMFLSSYEKLREKVISSKFMESMLHLGPRAFEEIGGEVVQSTTFVLRNVTILDVDSTFVRLIDERTAKEKKEKTTDAIKNPNISYRYAFKQENFSKIPGSPFAYWANETHYQAYEKSKLLKEVSTIRKGLATGNTDLFIKYWFEVSNKGINFDNNNKNDNYKWYPCHKGGSFRKWYGNMEKIINWENDGYLIKNYKDENGKLKSRPQNLDYMLNRGIIFSKITSAGSSCRLMTGNEFFDDAVQGIFIKDKSITVEYLLAVLNSPIIAEFLKILNPTLNKQINDLERIPIIVSEKAGKINEFSKRMIKMAQDDWDEKELSWNYSSSPLMSHPGDTIKQRLEHIKKRTINNNIEKERIEETINKLLFETYNVNIKIGEIDIYNNDLNDTFDKNTIREFLSYFIGCCFGRYSIDKEGLIYAGGTFNIPYFKNLHLDEDNILPVLKVSYFEDDIVTKLVEFIRTIFGAKSLEENLTFVADAIGRKTNETARESIGRYFMNDFYKDHLQTYKNRPIYWLFTSGKEKAFNCLIYMHRYDKTTLSRIRTDYLHEVQIRMDAEKRDLINIIEGDSTAKENSDAKKELKSLDKKIDELKAYDELLHHKADRQIEIDLDDGVAVNYAKFEGLVAKI